MKKVTVLGCGPSGLLAAHAVAQAGGAQLEILSKKEPSFIAGAQYLHEAVPDLTEGQPDEWIQVRKRGTRNGYASKVYGYEDAPVSWDLYPEGDFPAWNLRAIYRELWRRYEGWVQDVELDPTSLGNYLYEADPDLVVSTIPAPALCRRKRPQIGQPDPHVFLSQTVHIVQHEDAYPNELSFIEYNGEDAPSYYRRSIIFGTEAVEWSDQGPRPPVDGLVTINKPLDTDCDCWEDIVVRQGRYGAWHKSFLTHHVFNNVTDELESLDALL